MAAYNLIATTTVGSGGAGSIVFSSIPQTFTDLKVVVSVRSSTTAANTGNYDPFGLQFNSSNSGYTARELYGSGSAAASASLTTMTSFIGVTVARLTDGGINNSNSTASAFSSVDLYIPNYTSANNKSFSMDFVEEQNQTANYGGLIAGLWSNTTAITSVSLFLKDGNFVQYSSASLYGIKNS
jgi:hypothetical protein